MRRLCALGSILAVALALVASAFAGPPPPTAAANGSLTVDNGRGLVLVQASGGMNGRFDSGRLIVEDDFDGDGHGVDVNGAKRVRETKTGTVYEGENVSFIVKGSDRFRVRITAVGIDMWVVGRGVVSLDGTGFTEAGRYQVNGGTWLPVPVDVPAKLSLGGQQAAAGATR